MSPFPRDDLFIGLDPDRLTLVRRRRRLRSRWLGAGVEALPTGYWNRPDPAWLAKILSGDAWHGTRAQIVISDALVRYFIVERPVGARSLEELQMAAGLRFESLYGDAPADWQLQTDFVPWTTNFLGCAVRRAHLACLSDAATEAGIPIAGVTPFAVTQWNRRPRLSRPRASCFVALAGQSAWIAIHRDHRWQSVASHRLREDWAVSLPPLIQRERMRQGLHDDATAGIELAGVVDGPLPLLLADAGVRRALASWPGARLTADPYYMPLAALWPACR